MKVDIYTTPTCGYCYQAKYFLAERGIAFTEHDVSRDRVAANQMVRLTGQMGVPVIVIDGHVVIGFERAQMEQLLRGARHHQPPPLGLKVANVNRNSDYRGVYIGSVVPSSPGEKAGLRPGDIILSANFKQISGVVDFERILSSLSPGSQLSLTFIRNGQILQSEITV